MSRYLVVFGVAVALYLPTARYGFVQDDRAIIAANPAAHSLGESIRGFARPYWPPPAEGGLYRPLTILTYAVDWTLSGGRAGWLHVMNALWHGLVAVLIVAVFTRWFPTGAVVAGLLFAVHPLHVEGVASLVSRAELLAGAGVLGAVLAARRARWLAALGLAVVAMLSKEHGVITGVVILIDDCLQNPPRPQYPYRFYAALTVVTLGFGVLWFAVGRQGTMDVAPPFLGASVADRLVLAGSAIWRAAGLLVWPAVLSADYDPQVIPVARGVSAAALAGWAIVVAMPAIVWVTWRRAPGIAFAAALAILSYLPTSNLLFPSGVVLAERNLYLAVALVAALGAAATEAGVQRWGRRPVAVVVLATSLACGSRTLARLPAWRDNRNHLLTLLADHPESYRAHASAAAVLAGAGDTAGARRQYEVADALFAGDPHLDAARALYLLDHGDSTVPAMLARRARARLPRERNALRVQFLLARARGDVHSAIALADTAGRWYPTERTWYLQYLH